MSYSQIQRFERLCESLEAARGIPDVSERALYLKGVADSIRDLPVNQQMKVWFLERAVELCKDEIAA